MTKHLKEIKVILPDKIFIELALQAHYRKITLNDFIIMILEDFVETEFSTIKEE